MTDPPTPSSPGRQLPSPRNPAWQLVADNNLKAINALERLSHALTRQRMRDFGFPPYFVEREATDLAREALTHVMVYAHSAKQIAYERPEQLLSGFIDKGCLKLSERLADRRMVALPAGVDFDPADESPTSINAIMVFETRWKAVIAAYEAELRPDCRELLQLLYIDDVPYAEVSELLGVPKDRLYQRSFSCRAYLRKTMKQWEKRLQGLYTAPWETIWNIAHAKKTDP
jgi:DNA-directed RNA polymerase specialized sigma24 family protein